MKKYWAYLPLFLTGIALLTSCQTARDDDDVEPVVVLKECPDPLFYQHQTPRPLVETAWILKPRGAR